MYLKIHFYKENCVLKSLVYSSLTEQDISYMHVYNEESESNFHV